MTGLQFDDSPYTQLSSPARGDVQGVIKDVSETLPENQTKYATQEDLHQFGSWSSKVRSVTASANVTLADTDPMFVDINPNGSDRNVTCPAKSDDNHGYWLTHSGTANILTIKRSGGTIIGYVRVGQTVYIRPSTLQDFYVVAGIMETAYKITPSVTSNNLTVALTHADGVTPSTTRPLWFKINGQWRAQTTALSITLNAGTQYFALGTPFAAKEQQLFCYVSWIAASSAVGFHFARMPYGSVYSDFSSTNTNEKYLASTATPASTDDLENIGRFSITLGASASYNWSQPTYTSANLKQYPIYETDWLNWAPAPTGYSVVPPTAVYQYKWEGKDIRYFVREATTDGTSNATTITMTAPFTALTLTNAAWVGVGALARDNGAGVTTTPIASIASGAATINFFKDSNGAAWTNVNGKRIGYLEGRYPVAA